MKLPCVRASFFMLSLALFASCSGTAPSLDQIEWRVLYRDDGLYRFEELSMFFRASDPDGPDDPERITVSAGETGLEWTFTREEWLRKTGGGESWWGLPSMIPAAGSRLPDVLYRVRLHDLAGRYSEVTFRPDPSRPAIDGLDWPEIALTDGAVRMGGPYDQAYLILRDSLLAHLNTVAVSDGTAVDFGEALWWEAWIPMEDVSRGFRLGPYPVSRTDMQ